MNSKILSKADEVVSGSRQGDYGHPIDNFTTIAHLWTDYLGHHITPHDVGIMMMLLKIARLKNTPYHTDSLVDICGYAKCLELINDFNEEFRTQNLRPESDSPHASGSE